MKTKKITFNMVAAKIDQTEPTDTFSYDEFTIEVKKRLDMKHALQFTQDVVATCFDEEEADYIPEIFDAAVRICTLMYYAGFDAPKDAAKAYAVVYGTDLYDKIVDMIDEEQYKQLVDGAYDKVCFKRDLLTTTAAQKVTELIGMMDEIISKSAEAMQGMDTEKLTNAMKELSDKLNAKADETQRKDADNVIVMPLRSGDDA